MLRRATYPILFCLPVLLLANTLFASQKHDLNGTWRVVPTRSQFGGEPVIQTGTVTIADREHNIYISRNYDFDGESGVVSYQTSTDGRENSSIHEGKAFKTKAKFEGGDLVVRSSQDNITTTERYHLNPDGTMSLTVDRPGHHTLVLLFERQ